MVDQSIKPAILSLMLMQTAHANLNKLNLDFETAVKLLDPYKIRIALTISRTPPLSFPEPYDPSFDASSMAKSSQAKISGTTGTLRVIGTKFSPNALANGVTEVDPAIQRKFIILNTDRPSLDGSALIHEMIHATGLEKADHDPDTTSVFNEFNGGGTTPPRTILKPMYAKRLSEAFFASRVG